MGDLMLRAIHLDEMWWELGETLRFLTWDLQIVECASEGLAMIGWPREDSQCNKEGLKRQDNRLTYQKIDPPHCNWGRPS